jgi:MFS family permease
MASVVAPPQPAPAAMSDGRFYVAIAVLMAVEVMSSLESSMIYTALPTIGREFNDPHATGWLVTAFLLIQAGTAAIGGRLGDIFGRKRVLLIILALCALGSLVSALSPTLGPMIAGRAVQGLSGAILPLCYGIVRQMTTPQRAPFWIGCLTGAWSFSAAAGYIVAGYLSDIGSWRSIFWFTAIYGAALIIPLLALVPETRNPLASKRIDMVGGLLFVPAVGAMLYGLTSGGKAGWDAGATWIALLGGAALLVFWVWWEATRDDPLIDVKLMRRREIALGNICAAFLGLGLVQLPLISMMFLQQPVEVGGMGVSATMSGVLKLPSNVAALVAAIVSGWVAGRYGSRWAVFQGALVGVAAWVFLFFSHDVLWQVVLGTVIAAFGSTMLLAGLPNLVLEGAPVERSSEVTGLTMVIRSMFNAAGAQVVATLLATSRVSLPDGSATVPSEGAYEAGFLYLAATAAVIAVASLLIGKRKPTPG